jgi:hypothetical protein
MSDPAETALNLLLFTVGGVAFGCDADQAASIAACREEQASDLFWFHEELGFRGAPVSYREPTTVTVRTGGQSYRVIIDALDEIVEFGRSDLQPLPALLEPFALRKGIWAVVRRKDKLVLLVDFLLLLRNKGLRINDDTK